MVTVGLVSLLRIDFQVQKHKLSAGEMSGRRKGHVFLRSPYHLLRDQAANRRAARSRLYERRDPRIKNSVLGSTHIL